MLKSHDKSVISYYNEGKKYEFKVKKNVEICLKNHKL
jgi:hypothetical protein